MFKSEHLFRLSSLWLNLSNHWIYLQLIFLWLDFVLEIFFSEIEITKDCTKMSGSFCCDVDVTTSEYSFSIFLTMLLYNKEWLWWFWVVPIFGPYVIRLSHQILISSNFPALVSSSAKAKCLRFLLMDWRWSSNGVKPKAHAAIAVRFPCVFPMRDINSFPPIMKSRTGIA